VARLLPGSQDELLTLVPAADRAGDDRGRARPRVVGRGRGGVPPASARRSHGGGPHGDQRRRARRVRADPRARLAAAGLGGVLAVDNLVLYAALAAFGHAPSIWVVAMAYLVGMLANSVPVPGGFLAVEGGLVGMLLLFGAHPGSVVIAAVVVYRAISL